MTRDRDNMTKKLAEEHDQRRIEQMEVAFCHHCYPSHLCNHHNHHDRWRIKEIQIVLVVIAFPIAIVFVISIVTIIVIINR